MLGFVWVIDVGCEVVLGGSRQCWLLVVLFFGVGWVVSFDCFIDVVWGDEDLLVNASRMVLFYVSRLCTVMGEGYVGIRGDGYVLDLRGVMLDVDWFVDLVGELMGVQLVRVLLLLDEVLGLWWGWVFGDLVDEEWCCLVVVWLEELRLVVLEVWV